MELDFFQKKETDDSIDNGMVQKNIFNKLIVMNNVSGLADKSNEFANFFTVARKFSFTLCFSYNLPL